MHSDSITITGIDSGLGKYIYNNINKQVYGLNRKTNINNKSFKILIHCAFSSIPYYKLDTTGATKYINDNVIYTLKLLKNTKGKFIVISSVDTYERNNIYSATKLLIEELIKSFSKDYCILKCSGLLGKDSRNNTIKKLLNNKKLSLMQYSKVDYVLHKDLLEIIQIVIDKNLKGTFDITSSESITLRELARELNKTPKFGNYIYSIPLLTSSKDIFPCLKYTTLENIKRYIND